MELERRLTEDGDTVWTAREHADAPLRMAPLGLRLAELLRGDVPKPDAWGPVEDEAWPTRLLAPVDPFQEVWAAGVTYEASRSARAEESGNPDLYAQAYSADRPELFFKSMGWRVRGSGEEIRIREDSSWDVPEPELAAVLSPNGEIFGWTICNDVSSRSIEGENPLYLPQAKIWDGSCALGPKIVTADTVADPYSLTIEMSIIRDGVTAWHDKSSTARLRRRVDYLTDYLFRSIEYPDGVILSTGTCLVPDSTFTLAPGDVVQIAISDLGVLTNTVAKAI